MSDSMDTVRKNLAYDIAEEMAILMPSPDPLVKSFSDFPLEFLEPVIKAVADFQPKFDQLIKEGFKGVSYDTVYGPILGVMVPLLGGKYLAFAVQAPCVDLNSDTGDNTQVLYVCAMDVTATPEPADTLNDDRVVGVFKCVKMDGGPIHLNEHVAELIDVIHKTRMENKT